MIGLRGWFAEEAGEMEGEILGDCRTLEWVTAGAGVRSHTAPRYRKWRGCLRSWVRETVGTHRSYSPLSSAGVLLFSSGPSWHGRVLCGCDGRTAKQKAFPSPATRAWLPRTTKWTFAVPKTGVVIFSASSKLIIMGPNLWIFLRWEQSINHREAAFSVMSMQFLYKQE